MAQLSGYWTTGGSTGHRQASYTQDQMGTANKILAACAGYQGVAPAFLNELRGTYTLANTVSIGTGGGIVDGKWYINDSNVTLTIPSATGTGNSRIDLIVLRCNWNAYTAEIAIVTGVNASNPTAPSVTQNAGSLYEIPLFEALVSRTGVITLTDIRVFATATLPDGSINTSKLENNSVTTDKIVNANVTTAKLASNAVSTVKIADASVTTEKLADVSVTTNKLADANITTVKLASNAVSTDKIGNKVVTTEKLADVSVTNDKLAVGAVSNSKLASNAVSTDKLADVSVTKDKLAPSSVSNSKLEDNIISTSKIIDKSVTKAKLGAMETVVYINCVKATTKLKVANGVMYFTVPKELNGGKLITAHAVVNVAGNSGNTVVQVNNWRTGDMLNPKITIAAGAYSSYTHGTPAVSNLSVLNTGDRLRIDITSISTNTTGLDVILVFEK